MIRPATVQDIPELKKIWEASYDDSLNYVDFLYDKITTPEKTLVWDEDGEIRCMATSIMCSFRFKEQSFKCVYIYGCASLPKYEWEKTTIQLISRIEHDAILEGAQMGIIVPGNKVMYHYFQKHGYTSQFPIRKMTLRPGILGGGMEPDTPIVTNRISSEKIYEIREKALYDIPHITWEASQIDVLVLDALIYGEYLVSYEGEMGESYAFVTMRGRHMYVRECLGTTEESVRVLLSGLIEDTNPVRVHMNQPIGGGLLPYEGRKNVFGLAKSFNTAREITDFAPYINLML